MNVKDQTQLMKTDGTLFKKGETVALIAMDRMLASPNNVVLSKPKSKNDARTSEAAVHEPIMRDGMKKRQLDEDIDAYT